MFDNAIPSNQRPTAITKASLTFLLGVFLKVLSSYLIWQSVTQGKRIPLINTYYVTLHGKTETNAFLLNGPEKRL